MLDFVLVPLLALHLLCVNVAAAGPLICLWLEWKEGRGSELAGRAATWLGTVACWTLLAGGLLGLLIGWLHWSEDYAALWNGTLRKKAWWGVGEYMFSLGMSTGYAWWRRAGAERGRWLRQAVLLMSGTNLLYHFPFLFSVAVSARESGADAVPLSAAEFRGWMMRPDVLSRVIHVVLASFAVTGIALLAHSQRAQHQADESTRIAHWGGWIALVPSLVQIPVGLWLITSLPPGWQSRVMGGDAVATVMLIVSILLALWFMQDLAAITLGEVERQHVVRSIVLMLLVVLLMTGVLRRMRPPHTESNQENQVIRLHASRTKPC